MVWKTAGFWPRDRHAVAGFLACAFFFFGAMVSVGDSGAAEDSGVGPGSGRTIMPADGPGNKRKVLYLDSYHAEYPASIQTQKGARDVLEAAGVEMEVFYLDGKRKGSDEELRRAAEEARQAIEKMKPDLIIASDDPASQFVIVPYYKNTAMPVVFNGINWDASVYGFPARNVTGQVEIELVQDLLTQLKKYAKGGRIGFLSGDTATDRVNLKYYQEKLGIRFSAIHFVTTFDQWERTYRALQKEVDLLLNRNNAGITGWNDAQAEALVAGSTLVPSGSDTASMGRFVLLDYAKIREEFGEWSARTALRILRGTSPADIPLTTNKQARIFLNMKLARKLGIKFPIELIERSTFIEEQAR